MHQTIDATSTRARLAAACHLAKRAFPKVGTLEHPTPWDDQHVDINDLLDELEWVEE